MHLFDFIDLLGVFRLFTFAADRKTLSETCEDSNTLEKKWPILH